MLTSNTLRGLVGAVVVATALIAGCTSSRELAGPVNPGSDATLAAPATDTAPELAPTTAAPVADAPVTAAPNSTEAPVQTTAPTTAVPTTLEPTTTTEATATTTISANIVTVAKAPEAMPVVGGRSGSNTSVVQARLLELGFWLSGVDGEYGLTTKQAVMAFQKYVGLPADGRVDDWTAFMLTETTEKPHGKTDTGTLVEIDKTRQLLFLVTEGKTQWIFNTSTGNGKEYTEEDKNTPGEFVTGVSLTPDGLFKVNRERPEGWWEGDLGKIYRPKYFRGESPCTARAAYPTTRPRTDAFA